MADNNNTAENKIKALFVLVAMAFGISYWVYNAHFAPCPTGTFEISGYINGTYSRLCVPKQDPEPGDHHK